jgi:outer membrane protein assembly factor BamB
LYTINKLTGAATLVGDTSSFFDSIAFAPDGTLYLSAADLDFVTGNTINFRLQTLDPSNANVLTTVSTSEFYGALGIRPTDGVIFAGNGDQAQLFTLNPTTGAETLLGSTGRTFVGDIDFLVPEPASIALTGLGALGLALWKTRRRK